MGSLIRCAACVASISLVAACGGGRPAFVHFARPPLGAAARPPTPEASFRSKAPTSEAVVSFDVPAVNRRKLSNGVQLIVLERHDFPAVAIRIVSDVGDEIAGGTAIGLLHGDSLFDGTTSTKPQAVHRMLRAHGVFYGARSSFGRTVIVSDVLSTETARTLEILGELLRAPSFGELELRRRIALERAERRGVDPEDVASEAAMHSMSLDRPSRSDIAAVTGKDLRDFHERVFRADHVTIVVVGDVATEAVAKKVEATFAWMPSSGDAATIASTPPLEKKQPKIRIVDRAGPQAVIACIWRGPSITAPDYVDSAAAVELLRARLYEDLRLENAFTYGVAQSQFTRPDGGALVYLQASVDLEHTAESVAELFAQVQALGDAQSERTLARARKAALSSLASSFETAESAADVEAELAASHVSTDGFASWPKRIAALDAGRLQDEAKSFLTLDALHVVIVGDAKRVRTQLAAAGMEDVEVSESPD